MSEYGYVFFNYDCGSKLLEEKYASDLEEYRKAAEAGDTIAMCNIGYMYENGYGGLNMDDASAREWYQKAAEHGDVRAMYLLGNTYQYDGKSSDYTKAMEWHLKAAELGNTDSMSSIRQMYEQGWGVETDLKEARKWSKKASESNNNINYDGYLDYYSDLSECSQEAVGMIQKAADAGYATAMNNLGYWGYEKRYIEYDSDKARYWYEKAAKEGLAVAMSNLGFLYQRSDNYDSAMEWLIKAYANGSDYVVIDDIKNMLVYKQGVNAYFANYGKLISVNRS